MGGHVGEVFGGKELVVIVKDRIMRHVFIGISAEQQTDGGVVTFGAYHARPSAVGSCKIML